jgi:hypothetical protein
MDGHALPAPDDGTNSVLAISGNISGGNGEEDFIYTNTTLPGGFRFLRMTGPSSYIDLMYINGNGVVSIDGTANINNVNISSAGIGFADISTAYIGSLYTYSDRSFKKEITPIQNGLQSILAIEGVQYKLKDFADQRMHFGVIANDIKKVLPEVVTGSPGKMAVAYTELIPVLIRAIQEQQRQIEALNKVILDRK